MKRDRNEQILDKLCYYCSGDPSWIGYVRLVTDMVHYIACFICSSGWSVGVVLCCAV